MTMVSSISGCLGLQAARPQANQVHRVPRCGQYVPERAGPLSGDQQQIRPGRRLCPYRYDRNSSVVQSQETAVNLYFLVQTKILAALAGIDCDRIRRQRYWSHNDRCLGTISNDLSDASQTGLRLWMMLNTNNFDTCGVGGGSIGFESTVASQRTLRSLSASRSHSGCRLRIERLI